MAAPGQYDVIVVGSGLGGLTAAALLAEAGRKVLVLEAEDACGGFAAGFDWRGPRFDQALHLVMGAGPRSSEGEGLITDLLERLRLADRVEFVRADPFFRAVFPGLDVTVSGAGRRGFVESHEAHFPGSAPALNALLDTSSRIHRASLSFPIAPSRWQRLLAPLRFPSLVRNLNATLDATLDRYRLDPGARALLGALWMYLGLPPSRVSFLVWAGMTSSMVDEGAFYSMGGFRKLPEALQLGIERLGGHVSTSAVVERIHVDQGRVRGVSTTDGRTFDAPIVISNCDARRTVHDLIGAGHCPPEYRSKVDRLRPSMSVVALYTAVPDHLVPPDSVHETVVFSSPDHDANYEEGLAGRITGATVTVPTLTDRTVAPPGEHLVVIKGMTPGEAAGPPEDAPMQLAACADGVLPGLEEYLSIGPQTPRGDPERYALRTLGPIYGWARSPDQVGPHGLPNTTPIDGLYLCGHWSQPGAGVRTVIISGMRVSRLILGDRTSRGVVS